MDQIAPPRVYMIGLRKSGQILSVTAKATFVAK
jgi:hypothetical protein